MGIGSLRGSIFALSSSAIGSGKITLSHTVGVITFPKIFEENGWLIGLLLLIMGGIGC